LPHTEQKEVWGQQLRRRSRQTESLSVLNEDCQYTDVSTLCNHKEVCAPSYLWELGISTSNHIPDCRSLHSVYKGKFPTCTQRQMTYLGFTIWQKQIGTTPILARSCSVSNKYHFSPHQLLWVLQEHFLKIPQKCSQNIRIYFNKTL